MMEMGKGGMIDCKEAERRLHRYLDRELSEDEAAEVQQHLSMCDNCRARFRLRGGSAPGPQGWAGRSEHQPG